MSEPLLPIHGQPTLAELLPAIGSHLGLPGTDQLELPHAPRYVVLLVDGLGQQVLQQHLRWAPYLAGLFGEVLVTAVPSTTATSITTLCTGVLPGQHGIVGYSFRVPESGERLNALTWQNGPKDVERFQPAPPVFERVAALGVAASVVTASKFEGSGLTRAAMRGATFLPVDAGTTMDAYIDLVVAASTTAPSSLTYAYEPRLDHAGHAEGVGSDRWLQALQRVDRLAETLRERLPDDVVLVITGDHGMVNVPEDRRIIAEQVPALVEGVSLIAGEARFRQLYTPTPDAVAARWRQVLGDHAWVVTRDDAEARGWYGHVAGDVRERIGDVLVAMRDDHAVLTTTFPGEFTMVGFHGSLTEAEVYVPLLVDEGGN